MSLWRDKRRGDWRYRFEVNKKSYAAGGFKTKFEARAAREVGVGAMSELKWSFANA